MIGPSILGVSEGHSDSLTGLAGLPARLPALAIRAAHTLNSAFIGHCLLCCAVTGTVLFSFFFFKLKTSGLNVTSSRHCLNFSLLQSGGALMLMDFPQGLYSSSCHGSSKSSKICLVILLVVTTGADPRDQFVSRFSPLLLFRFSDSALSEHFVRPPRPYTRG